MIIHSIPIIDHPVESYTNCQVSGWGATQWQGSMPSELRKANVSIVPREDCNSTAGYGSLIVDGMICANGISEDMRIIDVCQGGENCLENCGLTSLGLGMFSVLGLVEGDGAKLEE